MVTNQDRRKKPRPVRVLVAIEQDETRIHAVSALGAQHYAVVAAKDAEAALTCGDKQGFDLLILDAGIEHAPFDVKNALTRMVEAWKSLPKQRHTPILLLAQAKDAAKVAKAYMAGVTGFLTYPVLWDMLDHHIRFLLRESRQSLDVRHALMDAEAHSRTRDNLLSIIRHEMKTPLHAISGFTRLAMDSQASGDVAALNLHLDQLVESGKSLLHTLGDMALYSDLIAGRIMPDYEEMMADWVVGDALDLKARAISTSEMRIHRAMNATKSGLMADAGLLSSAIARLVDNALRHAKGAKNITITLEDSTSQRLSLHVEDDGEGIEASAIPACLAPFSQRDMSLARSGEGLGLGLPIAMEIAKLHGGTLIMHSQLGKGTRVSLELPTHDFKLV